jgi:hypothetical protein
VKFIGYELRKLAGVRYIWVLFAVMLAANAALAFYSCWQSTRGGISSDKVDYIFNLYREDQAQVDADYAKSQELQDEQNKLFMAAIAEGNYDYTPEQPANKYFEDVSDQALLNEIYSRRDSITSYSPDLQKVIDRAYANIAEFDAMGISADAYTYKYQYRVIELYKAAQANVRMGLEYTRGWSDYFDYDAVNIFIFAMVVIIGSVVFAQEKNSGFLSIIRVSRHGRMKTATAKLAAMLLVTAFVTLTFIFTTWAVYGLRIGFSSTENAMQVLTEFRYSPFIITVGEYFAVTVAVKLATFLLFAVLVLAISVFFYNYALIYACGLGFFGLNFLFYTLSYINADNPLKNLNFVATAAVNPLFVRYRSINIFTAVVGYVPFMCAVFAVLFIAASVVTVVKYNRGAVIVNTAWLGKFTQLLKMLPENINLRFGMKRGKGKPRTYSRSLFAAELYKTFISSKYILLIIILLCVKCWLSYGDFKPRSSYSDAVYKEYMTTLAGPITDQKRQYLISERTMINDTLSRQQDMQQKYANDEITFEEYRDYLTKYNYAYSRDEYLKVIEGHADYIDRIKSEKGIEADFVYDTGWRTLFFSGFDFTLYAAILLLFAGSFADEYTGRSSSGSFAQILRVTKNGRTRTFQVKLGSALAAAAVLTVIWNGVDLFLIARSYQLPLISSPLVSIEAFQNFDSNITIGAYLAEFYALRIIGTLALACAVCALSEILRKIIPVMAVTVAVTLFPALLSYFGMSVFDYADFTGLSRATPLALLSASGKSDLGLICVFLAATALICGAAAARAVRTWTK